MHDPVDQGEHLRSVDIVRLLSARPLWRVIRGGLRAPFDAGYAGSPVAVCWFTNFSCNARCAFCCKAAEIAAGREGFPPLPPGRFEDLLVRIRRSVDLLYLSGGEPLIHPQILDILKAARELEFHSIGLSSNLIALARVPEVLDYLDVISVSIHSPNVEVHAANLRVSPAVAQQVFDNLELVKAARRRRRLKLLVNCVINEQNLSSVLDMVAFTKRHGCMLEFVPANEDGRIPRGLAGNPEYLRVIDELLRLRRFKQAPHLAGSTHYYERIRGFEPFRCFPYGVPNIMPDGRLCTPCDVSGQHAVNVLDYPDLKTAIKASLPSLGAYPCKRGMCFKAGIIERSHLFGLLVRN